MQEEIRKRLSSLRDDVTRQKREAEELEAARRDYEAQRLAELEARRDAARLAAQQELQRKQEQALQARVLIEQRLKAYVDPDDSVVQIHMRFYSSERREYLIEFRPDWDQPPVRTLKLLVDRWEETLRVSWDPPSSPTTTQALAGLDDDLLDRLILELLH